MASYFDEECNVWVGGEKPRKSDEKSPKQLEFEKHYDLASRGYMGGLNSSYVIGEVKGEIIDIDFSSCYPSALNMIQNMTYDVSGGIEEFKIELEKYDGTHLPIAIADIEFEFPADCLYSSQPIKNGVAGLFYVLKGRTTCTLPEIHLALQQGCVITNWHEAVVMKCDEGFTFRGFISILIQARDDAKKEGNNMLQLILKDSVNGMYGKVAQGINRRPTYIVGKGVSRPLPPSAVTNPYIASAVTGVVRAALSSIVHALSTLDGYMVISATTDGVLYKSPLSEGCTSVSDLLFDAAVIEKKYTGSIVQALEGGSNDYIKSFESVDKVLYQELLKYPSIRLLQASRAVWGFDEFIEIKHIATEVTNLKTRGQVGFYEYEGVKYPTVLAKAGNKIDGSKLEQATELLKMFYDDEIAYNEVTTLASMRDILDPKKAVNDLVSVKTRVKVNTDYDFKRRPVYSGREEDSQMLIRTVPFKDIEEANLYRGCAKNLRANGFKADCYRVEYAVHLAKNNVIKRGGSKDFTTRHFLRALIQGIRPFPDTVDLSYADVANSLEHCGVTVNKVKDAKRYPFIFNVVDNTSANRKLIKFLLEAFGFGALYGEVLQILVFKGVSNGYEIIQAP